MVPTTRKIDASILLRANAEMMDQINLLNEVAISRWTIDRNSVAYEKTDSHTLSLYLKGGDTSYRADQRSNSGAPGRLCLMPQGHASQWHIGDKVNFAHLYFSDTFFKHYAASHLEYDARLIELRDVTYADDTVLQHLLTTYFAQCEAARHCASMESEQTLMQIFNHLICSYGAIELKNRTIKSGLSNYHRKIVRSAIAERLQEKLTISDMAKLTGHSPYHFAHMFKLSFGAAPAQYINRQRIERAKTMLGTNASLACISAKLGFAHQSHMTTQFRNIVGVTPGAYRACLKS
ncbi:helix-turn-helix domain-containing protein [Kordiimonas sp.]|uniref:helix-turn-helix domain-containing protein n=1 Tax=Kordiimonas sp. TaxID=1970157 RepID=UPI003A9577D2